MRRSRVAASFTLVCLVLAGCAGSDSDQTVHRPAGFNRAHSWYDSYGPYGSVGGFMNPGACWRSTPTPEC
ncbi:MAG: hypothetical protein QOK29_1637 [Rhodospirillaceae bacterium]|jgi:hypothetical protein|nr:hypothetical protein [Rhodospirillaceae bacterium]